MFKLVLALLFFSSHIIAQNAIAPMAINAAGTSQAQANNIWLEIAVGEIGTTTISNNTHTITQGVLQPNYVITTPIIELGASQYISIYPNPTSDLINIEPNNITITEIRVLNILGQVLIMQNTPPLSIDLSFLPTGSYSIQIFSKEYATPKTSTIIKN